ncbi:hypothetical protein CWE12_08690 [Aliidiomarina sedimenti]|uniref:Secreted protein n=1 Tax=Aliidiomarina sedimenti TaxID=1933879 RepID=A0ABY0BZD0_9GAMM|nr:hypothetical protein [Aliidiomarina sedimenti]RUO30027.1 hypothetical protein CWE12_08690 [Aliidiomarina sedimenti]
MKNYALAIALLTALGLTACSDPDDQQGDPTNPTQQVQQRQQAEDQDTGTAGERDATTMRSAQPAPADSELRPENDIQGRNQMQEFTQQQAEEHAELRTYLTSYTRNNEADSQDQCAFFALGDKPCGGPESYVVYSQKDLSDEDIANLEKRAQRYRELDAMMHAAEGMMSTCDVTPQPQVTLENGRCVARN